MRNCDYLFVGLLAVTLTFLQTGAISNHANLPEECCFKFYGRRIPFSKIDSYFETRIDCTKPGVVFVTKKGLRVCVQPGLEWVNKTMQLIDDREF